MEKRLTRIPSDAVLGGVASGMAKYFGIDTTIVRVLWAVALLLPILPPSFLWTTLLYVILWAVLPESSPETTINTPSSPQDTATREPIGSSFLPKSSDPDRTVKIIGVALLGLGGILLLNELPYWYQIRQYIWPIALIIGGAYLLLRQRDKEQYDGGSTYSPPPTPPTAPTPPVEPDPVPYRPFDAPKTEPTSGPDAPTTDPDGPIDPDGETDPGNEPPQIR